MSVCTTSSPLPVGMNRLPASDPHEQWWMGTPRAEGGLVVWKGNNCDEVFATNQGQPKPASAKFAFKCCKGTKPTHAVGNRRLQTRGGAGVSLNPILLDGVHAW